MNMKKMLAVVAAASLVAVAAPAFAANPFSDVPMNHWAYDAVEQLASKGILEGYPNGTFKGNRAMTRYEIASMVARMMNADLSGADLEQLKALIVEFQPELEALGVKVDSFDARLSALEKGVGGWKITGQMRFDYRGYDEATGEGGNEDNGFQMNRARIFLHRDLPQGVSFDARWHSDHFDRFYFTARDFWGVEGLTVKGGQFALDWEDEEGLYIDNDAFLMDTAYRGFDVKYENGGFVVEGFVASNKGNGSSGVYTSNAGDEYFGARLGYNFSDKGFIALHGLWTNDSNSIGDTDGTNFAAYWASLGYNIVDGLEIKGAYYFEDIEDDTVNTCASGEDSPQAFKVILDVDQSLLKFTSLWVEYANFDAGFILHNAPYTYDDNAWPGPDGDAELIDYISTGDEDVDALFIYAKQQWNAKWNTFERYVNYDADDDATEWGVGVGYQYSPNLYFELAYMDMDGRFENGGIDDDYDNSLIRFRTLFNF